MSFRGKMIEISINEVGQTTYFPTRKGTQYSSNTIDSTVSPAVEEPFEQYKIKSQQKL